MSSVILLKLYLSSFFFLWIGWIVAPIRSRLDDFFRYGIILWLVSGGLLLIWYL